MNDPRAIANYMLDAASSRSIELTNLSLQKLLFFGHAISLVENKKGLVTGYFEAWQFGPVHPTVYQSFKAAGAAPIGFRAQAVNPVTRLARPLASIEDALDRDVCDRVIFSFGRLSAGRLVDITHAEGGPWHHVVSNATNGANIGLRIPDKVIADRHHRLKVSVTPAPRVGEPNEDSPFI